MAEYFINADTGDNGTGDGSSGNPWLTLAYAYDNSAATDTITCQSATASYAWVTDTLANRTIKSADSTTPQTFDASAAAVQWFISGTLTIEYIIFTNNVLTADRDGPFEIGGSTGVFTFTGCQFNTITFRPVGLQGGFINAPSGISGGFTLTIDGCLFDDPKLGLSSTNAMFTLRSDAQLSATYTWTIKNSVFYFSATSPAQIQYLFDNYNFESGPTYNITLTNCIIYNDTGGTLTWKEATDGGTVNTTIDYCDHYLITSVPTATNSITDDPLFIGKDNSNFNLRPTSPAIGTGTAV